MKRCQARQLGLDLHKLELVIGLDPAGQRFSICLKQERLASA
jgi:hypothetical protein